MYVSCIYCRSLKLVTAQHLLGYIIKYSEIFIVNLSLLNVSCKNYKYTIYDLLSPILLFEHRKILKGPILGFTNVTIKISPAVMKLEISSLNNGLYTTSMF